MKKVRIIQLFMAGLVFLAGPVFSQTYIAGHLVAKEQILRNIRVLPAGSSTKAPILWALKPI